jgi:hypothetical protein
VNGKSKNLPVYYAMNEDAADSFRCFMAGEPRLKTCFLLARRVLFFTRQKETKGCAGEKKPGRAQWGNRHLPLA